MISLATAFHLRLPGLPFSIYHFSFAIGGFKLEVQRVEVVELFLSAKGAECNSQGQSAERSKARRP